MNVKEVIEQQRGFDRIHCPFGCSREDCEERGYCCHLVGFTNDKKVMDTLHWNERGLPCVRGGSSREKVKATDRLINPQQVQHDQAGSHVMDEWVSSRVYRKCTDAEKECWIAERVKKVDFEESVAEEVSG